MFSSKAERGCSFLKSANHRDKQPSFRGQGGNHSKWFNTQLMDSQPLMLTFWNTDPFYTGQRTEQEKHS